MNPLGEHTVFAAFLVAGAMVFVATVTGKQKFTFRSIEGLLLVFLFLAILSTFAPELAGAFALLVIVYVALKMLPKIKL